MGTDIKWVTLAMGIAAQCIFIGYIWATLTIKLDLSIEEIDKIEIELQERSYIVYSIQRLEESLKRVEKDLDAVKKEVL